jgi:hypothetical protein
MLCDRSGEETTTCDTSGELVRHLANRLKRGGTQCQYKHDPKAKVDPCSLFAFHTAAVVFAQPAPYPWPPFQQLIVAVPGTMLHYSKRCTLTHSDSAASTAMLPADCQ